MVGSGMGGAARITSLEAGAKEIGGAASDGGLGSKAASKLAVCFG